MELILIRHGMTPGNLERRFVGRLDQPLAPQGEELARTVAPTLPRVEHLYVSPMTRCRETADIIWPDVERTVIDDLRETDFGIYEGKCHAELVGDSVYQRWLNGELEIGEPIENCNARAASALREIAADIGQSGYERCAVVAHGGIFMGMLSQFAQPAKPYYDWLMPNCGGYRAELVTQPLTLRVLEAIGGAKA